RREPTRANAEAVSVMASRTHGVARALMIACNVEFIAVPSRKSAANAGALWREPGGGGAYAKSPCRRKRGGTPGQAVCFRGLAREPERPTPAAIAAPGRRSV